MMPQVDRFAILGKLAPAPFAAIIFAFSLALVALGLLPSAAYAQTAEQHARDMNDIAATAQAPNGSVSRPYSERSFQYDLRPSKSGNAAIAYHADTASSWVTTSYKNIDAAKKQALDGCNAATGGGCYIAAAYEGSADIKEYGEIFIAEDAMGQLWIKLEKKRSDTQYTYDYRITDPAKMLCQTNSFGCSMLAKYHNGHIFLDVDPDQDQSENFFPKGKLRWNRWAMVARPTTPTTAAHNKSWLISGKENSDATRKEILDRCQVDSGVPCSISAYAVNDSEVLTNDTGSANGLLVHFVNVRGQNRWISAVSTKPKKKKYKKLYRGEPDPVEAPDPVTVQERIDRICPKSSACRVVATYDAATPRMQVIEDVK